MEINKIQNRFNNVAIDYDKQRKLFIPCYDDYYGIVQTFLKFQKSTIQSVLDLGAGTGLLTMFVQQVIPDASYLLVDIAEKMLDVAKTRFSNCNNITYKTCDYCSNFPEGTFDLVVSSLSIHHLDDTEKQLLYGTIFKSLNKGGYFVNLDQFNADSKEVNDIYTDSWYESIKNSGISVDEMNSWLKRRELDKENTISQSLEMLKNSGFNNVECIYQHMKFGVIIGSK